MVPTVLFILSVRISAGIFRTGSHPRVPAVFGGVDSAVEHPSENGLKIAPATNDNNGVMLLCCIGDAVHR